MFCAKKVTKLPDLTVCITLNPRVFLPENPPVNLTMYWLFWGIFVAKGRRAAQGMYRVAAINPEF
jgi:hypothetical protein